MGNGASPQLVDKARKHSGQRHVVAAHGGVNAGYIRASATAGQRTEIQGR